jgi:ankyrin repeat protein
VTELGKAELVTFLLENGADSTIKDSKGKFALELAQVHGNSEIIRLLLD